MYDSYALVFDHAKSWKNFNDNKNKAIKTFLIIYSKDTYLLDKQYVSFNQTIRMLLNIYSDIT